MGMATQMALQLLPLGQRLGVAARAIVGGVGFEILTG